ncbi:MAG: bifunctional precorrin-2 dehydrogenase/sirohydrochlorin ferrochelatase [Desulfamplus sp.]|nr:bifunctional precorrin-2 dehydrogenase/sirohydrochlorin ferrochelatase [Desulfamplus sp.]
MKQKGDNKIDNNISTLQYYPIALDVKCKNCLVVGGGSVGARKALTLARCGAIVNVVSPIFSDEFTKHIIDKQKIINSQKITDSHNFISKPTTTENKNKIDSSNIVNNQHRLIKCIQKHYDSNDLNSIFLVIGATDNIGVNRQIANDARERQILCNIADFPEGSSFVLPSIVSRGDLVITVSTSGNSPAFAKKLRKELELQFGEEYAIFLTLMGNIRDWLLSKKNLQNDLRDKYSQVLPISQKMNSNIFRELVNSELLENIASGNYSEIDKTIKIILGKYLQPMDNISLPSYQDFISGE